MRRVGREVLRMRLWVALTVLRGPIRRSPDFQIEDERKKLVDYLVHRIMGPPDGELVMLEPDLVGSPHSPSLGKWDVDEPHPHPELPFTDH